MLCNYNSKPTRSIAHFTLMHSAIYKGSGANQPSRHFTCNQQHKRNLTPFMYCVQRPLFPPVFPSISIYFIEYIRHFGTSLPLLLHICITQITTIGVLLSEASIVHNNRSLLDNGFNQLHNTIRFTHRNIINNKIHYTHDFIRLTPRPNRHKYFIIQTNGFCHPIYKQKPQAIHTFLFSKTI